MKRIDNLKVVHRLMLAFGVTLMLTCLIASSALWRMSSMFDDFEDLGRDKLTNLMTADDLIVELLQAARHTRNVLILETPGEVKAEIDAVYRDLPKREQYLEHLKAGVTTAESKAALAEVIATNAIYVPLEDEYLRMAQAGHLDEAKAKLLKETRPAQLVVIDKLYKLIDVETGLVKNETIRVEVAYRNARATILALIVATLLISAVLVWWIVQTINRPLTRLLGSVTDIISSAKEQQVTANEIAATTVEIGATSKEISATSRELVKTLGEVSAVAEHSANLAGEGHAGLSQMEETMHNVMDAAKSINAKLAVLSEKASNINQVITTITKVADQTNLLSLNAAIEAEKAGEYGRGFSVVATEIRRLADQTAVATYDIEQMVKEIQSAVSAGVMGMDKFSEEVRRGMHEIQLVSGQLTQIIQQAQVLAPRVESVNEGMQAQSNGAEQITQALAQLSMAAQQTVESLRQSNTAIDVLSQASHVLRGGVSSFKLAVE